MSVQGGPGRIPGEVVATTRMGRSEARRMLTGPVLPEPAEQVDQRRLRAKTYPDESREPLEYVWASMGMQCEKYFVVMFPLWLPLLAGAGDLDKPFATSGTSADIEAMSAATIDRYLAPQPAAAWHLDHEPSPRNSIGLSEVGDAPATTPGVIEADIVAHCGSTFVGFARTLTMTSRVTGWTENASVRNNAPKWVLDAVEDLQDVFPFPLCVFDSDSGSEFLNYDVTGWPQERDIAQTRSRPYRKNNHVMRKHAFSWRYDTAQELTLLNRLWRLVSLRLNFFTPTKKPIQSATTTDRRCKRAYDKPAPSEWQRVLESGLLSWEEADTVGARTTSINPADPTRQINKIQLRLTELSQDKTEAFAAARGLDMASLEPSIHRLRDCPNNGSGALSVVSRGGCGGVGVGSRRGRTSGV